MFNFQQLTRGPPSSIYHSLKGSHLRIVFYCSTKLQRLPQRWMHGFYTIELVQSITLPNSDAIVMCGCFIIPWCFLDEKELKIRRFLQGDAVDSQDAV